VTARSGPESPWLGRRDSDDLEALSELQRLGEHLPVGEKRPVKMRCRNDGTRMVTVVYQVTPNAGGWEEADIEVYADARHQHELPATQRSPSRARSRKSWWTTRACCRRRSAVQTRTRRTRPPRSSRPSGPSCGWRTTLGKSTLIPCSLLVNLTERVAHTTRSRCQTVPRSSRPSGGGQPLGKSTLIPCTRQSSCETK
jgi:hypothetical protein